MLSPLLKVLSGVALVVGLLTGVGTIVGWIASDSFGDAFFGALRDLRLRRIHWLSRRHLDRSEVEC
jgi:hypothetical protein